MDTSCEDYVNQKLVEAGWYPGRKTDIHDMKYALIEDGFTVFPAAEAFLEEFGGLKLEARDPAIGNFIIDSKRYFEEHYGRISRDYIAYYENRIAKEKLCVVGFTDEEKVPLSAEVVFISESGRFYYYVKYMADIQETGDTDFRRILCDPLYS